MSDRELTLIEMVAVHAAAVLISLTVWALIGWAGGLIGAGVLQGVALIAFPVTVVAVVFAASSIRRGR